MSDSRVEPERRTSAPAKSRVVRRAAGSALRSSAYCAVLIPLGTVSLLVAPLGGARTVAAWWRRLRTGLLRRPDLPSRRPGVVAVFGHAVATVLLGVAAVPALATAVLMVARGLLYGFVDRGPYNTSWGGPTRAGAWAVHFLVGLPFFALALAALVGIAALHQRLTAALDRGRLAGWVVPLTLVLSVLAVGLVIAWSHQV